MGQRVYLCPALHCRARATLHVHPSFPIPHPVLLHVDQVTTINHVRVLPPQTHQSPLKGLINDVNNYIDTVPIPARCAEV